MTSLLKVHKVGHKQDNITIASLKRKEGSVEDNAPKEVMLKGCRLLVPKVRK